MYTQVIEEWKALGQFSGEQSESAFASAMERGFVSEGWKGAVAKAIQIREAQRTTRSSFACEIASLYAELGDREQAFRWLNIAYRQRDARLLGLKTSFLLESLRSDPRFIELLRKVGLPQ